MLFDDRFAGIESCRLGWLLLAGVDQGYGKNQHGGGCTDRPVHLRVNHTNLG
jgi:hypothetical protein